ncbi:MAG: glycosyltransferase [Candidatus Nanoarchaeia archaeon]|nr:glycosyltransferase [Candidatus Nanoarchaeia archaeon]MDD5358164.1 glycosyltransferase [Candidatus Nanoarchaeia archaeon]MDD5589351.1 glycosyltransferase [Candidatus Nanoarchaeia archaeon]
MKKSLSIIIPAYNEELRIKDTLKAYLGFFKEKKKNKEIEDFEILVVLNGCKDNTKKIVQQQICKELILLEFERAGKGFAIMQGFRKALERKMNIIGFVDADMATTPEAFYNLVLNIGNYGGVIASRYIKGAKISPKQTIQRIIASRIFNLWIKIFLVINYQDTQCGAKLFRREAIEKVINELTMTKWAFDVDLLYKMKKNGFKIKEVPTVWSDKKYSTINFMKSGPLMALAVARLRLLNSPFKFLIKPKMKINKIPDGNLRKMKDMKFREVGDYCHKNPLIKWLFWKRLKTMLKMAEGINGVKRVLDFGAGSGIFMPTLAKNFPEVYSLDLEVSSIEYVKELYRLKNVNIITGDDSNRLPFKDDFFDVIFAADVLEHFKDSYYIQEEFKRVLRKGGCLVVSGPTENIFYRLARKYVYKQKKPEDHYTDVYDVMKKTSRFLKIEKKKTLPCLLIPGFKIYKAKKAN